MEHTNDDLPLPLFPLRPQGVTRRTWQAFVVWVVFRDHFYDFLVCRMMGLIDDQELARWEQEATRAAARFLRRALDDCKEPTNLIEMPSNQKLTLMVVLVGRVDSLLQEVENDLGL